MMKAIGTSPRDSSVTPMTAALMQIQRRLDLTRVDVLSADESTG